MAEKKEAKPSFWTSLPGILTALAGLITAIATLVGVLRVAKPAGEDTASKPREPIVAQTSPLQLRPEPTTLSSAQLDSTLVRLGLYARGRSPIGNVTNRYQLQTTGQDVVLHDDATGLMWHPGSADPMPPEQAQQFASDLNAKTYGGYARWRLPTVEEVATLLEPQLVEGQQVDPVARSRQLTVQTADRTLDGGTWIVFLSDGTIGPEKPGYFAGVRAVRSAD